MYKDLDFEIGRNSQVGITTKTDVSAVEQSIMNIIMTEKGDRLFDPLFGSNIKRYLFGKVSMETMIEIRAEIEFALRNYEPRIDLTEVVTTPDYDNNAINVSVTYEYLKLGESQTFEFALKLV